MAVLNFIFGLLGVFLLFIGIVSVVILVKIGGGSDGPGAILFYIGAFIGLGGSWVIFSAMKSKG